MKEIFRELKLATRVLITICGVAVSVGLINDSSTFYHKALEEVRILDDYGLYSFGRELKKKLAKDHFRSYSNFRDSSDRFSLPIYLKIPEYFSSLSDFRRFFSGELEGEMYLPKLSGFEGENVHFWEDVMKFQDSSDSYSFHCYFGTDMSLARSNFIEKDVVEDSIRARMIYQKNGGGFGNKEWFFPCTSRSFYPSWDLYDWVYLQNHESKETAEAFKKLFSPYFFHRDIDGEVYYRDDIQKFIMPRTYVIWDEIKDMSPATAIMYLESKIATNLDEVSVLSFSFSINSLLLVFPLTIALVLMYLYGYMRHAIRNIQKLSKEEVPNWMPLFEGTMGVIGAVFMYFLIPVASITILLLGRWDIAHEDMYLTWGDVSSVAVIVPILLVFFTCLQLRKKVFKESNNKVELILPEKGS